MKIFSSQKFNSVKIQPSSATKTKEGKPLCCLQLKPQLSADTISFKGVKELGAKELTLQLEKEYGKLNIQELLKKALTDAIATGEKNAQQGSEYVYFRLKNALDFGVRIREPRLNTIKRPDNLYFTQEIDPNPEKNFGQIIFDSSFSAINFLKHVEGEVSSIPNWYKYHGKQELIGRDESLTYLEKLLKTSAMPQESFDQLANDLKIIKNEPAYSLDTVNPNNLIIDYKNKKFTFIDLYDTRCNYDDYLLDMLNPMTDRLYLKTYQKYFDESEILICMSAQQGLVYKIKTAIKNVIDFKHAYGFSKV